MALAKYFLFVYLRLSDFPIGIKVILAKKTENNNF